MVIVTIDGNIGSGKSSSIQQLQEILSKDKTIVLQEKIKNFEPWLKLYYSDMNRYAMGFQMEVLLSHLEQKKIMTSKTNQSKLILSERSPISCIHVFGELLKRKNIMCKEEQDLCIRYGDLYGWIPDYIFYIRATPTNCFKRVQLRNRKNENDITLDYLEEVDKLYNELYIDQSQKQQFKPKKIIVINGNQPLNKVINDIYSYLQEIISQ